jgi:hypothetical protein
VFDSASGSSQTLQIFSCILNSDVSSFDLAADSKNDAPLPLAGLGVVVRLPRLLSALYAPSLFHARKSK